MSRQKRRQNPNQKVKSHLSRQRSRKKTLVFLVKRLLVGIPTAAIADNKSEQIAKMQPHVTT